MFTHMDVFPLILFKGAAQKPIHCNVMLECLQCQYGWRCSLGAMVPQFTYNGSGLFVGR